MAKEVLRSSFSRLTTYRECPLRYRYLEVERLPEPRVPPDWRRAPLAAGLSAMVLERAFGAAVHRALKSWQEAVDAGTAPDPDALLAAVRAEVAGVDGTPTAAAPVARPVLRALARVEPHLRAYAVGPWPRRRSLWLEHSTTLTLASPRLEVEIALRLDRVAALPGGGAAILDFKTVSPHLLQRQRDRWQLRTYALAAATLGLDPARLRLVLVDLASGRELEVAASAAVLAASRRRLLDAAGGIASAGFSVAGHPRRPCWSCGFRLSCPRSLAPDPPVHLA